MISVIADLSEVVSEISNSPENALPHSIKNTTTTHLIYFLKRPPSFFNACEKYQTLDFKDFSVFHRPFFGIVAV